MNSNQAADPFPFFQKLEVPFEKAKEEVWAVLERKIGQAPPARIIRAGSYRYALAAAAAMALLLATALFMRYYSTSVHSAAGTQLAYTLPDGSAVKLNAGSELSYHPLWWKFSRILQLDGEGYFEVKPGKHFQVSSSNGKTTVVGTSFSIYSREDEYRVTCLTGQVSVRSKSSHEVVIGPDYQARIGRDGNILVTRQEDPAVSVSWLDGKFTFSSIPLRLALDEVERQFDVTINLQISGDGLYTGYFSRDKTVEDVLGLICKPFGLTFVRLTDRTYEIRQN